MRKSIIVAMGLALSLAGTAAAQVGAGETPRERGGDRGERGAQRGGRGMQGGPDGLLLKDITLTEGQRARIAQLRKTSRDSMQARREPREQRGIRGQEMRAARQRGDTVAIRGARQQARQDMEGERASHIAAIRAILTAEQQVQFDRNVAELQARMAERGERGPRDARPGHGGSSEHGSRPPRGGRPARG